MDYYIINDGFNWADEMDCEGFIILTQKHVDRYRKILPESKEEDDEVNEDYEDDDYDEGDAIELWCGSNQSIEIYPDTVEAIIEDLKNPTKITEQEYKTLKKLLNLRENTKSEDYLTSYGNSLTELYIRQRL